MGWILGGIGAGMAARLATVHPLARWRDEHATTYLAVGGLPETCQAGSLADGGAWAVVGLGLQRMGERCTWFEADAWAARLAHEQPDLSEIEGHFVAVRRQAGRVRCFTDPLGVRALYLTKLDQGVVFSTRLDWLVRLRGGGQLDLDAFGSHWRCFHQLATRSLVRDVYRLGPGGTAVCSEQGFEVSERLWQPEIDAADADGSEFADALAAFTNPALPAERTLSLSLSGGFDSRLLLARLLHDGRARAHTFGPAAHPDVRVARALAAGEHVPLRHLNPSVPDADRCRTLLAEVVAQNHAIAPASAAVGLDAFAALAAHRHVVVDGAMGELGRRKFLNRLLLQNRRAARTDDAAAIRPFFDFPRADVFSPEASAAMERGILRDIEALWASLPADASAENKLDVARVRAVLPNFYGYEQARLDGVVPAYMPFAQPSVVQAVFHVPLRLRRDSRLYRQLVQAWHPALRRYPLVKAGTTHPFRLGSLGAIGWTKIKRRLAPGYHDQRRLRFLETLRPYVLDLLESTSTKTFGAYDYVRLRSLVEGFYAGREDLAVPVDWWLAFETWRRMLGLR